MRTYISTIGYHSTRVMRPILNNGIDADDTVVLLRPAGDKNDQSNDAVRDIEQTVREIGPNTSVETAVVDHNDFETAVLDCADVLTAAKGEVVLNFDGGPREVFLPFVVAALSRPDLVDRSFQFRDTDQKVRELSIPDLVSSTSEVAATTLQAAAELGSDATLPAIAERTGKARSTVGRHLDQLEDAGRIETSTSGKTRAVSLTLAGKLQVER